MDEEDDEDDYDMAPTSMGTRLSTVAESADEEFAEDEFAEDDFADEQFAAKDVGFGPSAFPAKELDGWILDDAQTDMPGAVPVDDDPWAERKQEGSGDLSEDELERLFDAEEGDGENDGRADFGYEGQADFGWPRGGR